MIWISAIMTGVALVALIAVAASGTGPLRSLRRTIGGFDDVRDEADRLRRNIEVLEQRRRRLGERGDDPA